MSLKRRFPSYRQPSPLGEGAPQGRIGHKRYEREWEKSVSSALLTKAPYPPLTRSPFPDGEGLGGATLRVDFYKGRCLKVVGIAIWGNAFPTYGEANPVSLRSTAPSRGRGENVGRFKCIDPSFLWKEVPAGRRLGAQSGVTDDADGKTFLHKSLLTRVPYPPLRVDFYKGRCLKAVLGHPGHQSLVTRGSYFPAAHSLNPLSPVNST